MCTARNVSMNIFVQRLTATSNVFFSKNILFYNIIYFYIIIILYFISYTAQLFVSMNIFAQRVTKTLNVFLSNPYFFKLADGISHVSVDRLT